ncbi:hypothetical protein [Metallosphaera javensis (ex Sakai et al. 2022)]|uniref:hypothetical protein n=1 Tax=Metallosphaera javensis (ex Sakai et al. 2022) TaxID=2775498 RepID=UPI00258EB1C1|nr:MAG: hypothetical protein MjAS7_1620 [Metallosphaera javensis (ex Sakai et al. 2022)]
MSVSGTRIVSEKRTWVSDVYNLYLLLQHKVVSSVNPNESLRDRLVRFKTYPRLTGTLR